LEIGGVSQKQPKILSKPASQNGVQIFLSATVWYLRRTGLVVGLAAVDFGFRIEVELVVGLVVGLVVVRGCVCVCLMTLFSKGVCSTDKQPIRLRAFLWGDHLDWPECPFLSPGCVFKHGCSSLTCHTMLSVWQGLRGHFPAGNNDWVPLGTVLVDEMFVASPLIFSLA